MSSLAPAYTGRFAPSPTGPLHLGSLYTALASFLQARSRHGKWLIRIDDLDTPRNQQGAAEAMLKTLDACGLYWDSSVTYQSQHVKFYEAILQDLADKCLLYRCQCSRKTLESIYTGTCRHHIISPEIPHALRLKTDARIIRFNDELQGSITHNLAQQHGDFIVKRKDTIIAYQFAVVIDDYLQGITHIVRGVDLLDATPKQIYCQQIIGLTTPHYAHVPVLIDAQGQKLSKQTLAKAVDTNEPALLLFNLLQLLQQNPAIELQYASVSELLAWAITHWQFTALKNLRTIAIKETPL